MKASTEYFEFQVNSLDRALQRLPAGGATVHRANNLRNTMLLVWQCFGEEYDKALSADLIDSIREAQSFVTSVLLRGR